MRTKRSMMVGAMLLTLSMLGTACNAPPQPTAPQSGQQGTTTAKESSVKTTQLAIQGMSCEGCAKRIQSALGALKGVDQAKVDFTKKIASVTFRPQYLSAEDLVAAVVQVGYKAELLAPILE